MSTYVDREGERDAADTDNHLRGVIQRKSADVTTVHVLRRGKPVCPKCGQGLEADGGSVLPMGSWDDGPLWWECEDCGEQWGHA